MHSKKAQVIMVTSAKGGTGKSVVSVLLGAALAARGLRTLVIELSDGPRTTDLPFGAHGNIVYDIGDMFDGRCDITKAIVPSPYYHGVHIVCAPRCGNIIKPDVLRKNLDKIRTHYSVIIIDVASGFGVPFKTACTVAQKAIIVTTPDVVTLNSEQALADILCDLPHIETKLFINKASYDLAGTGIRSFDECIDTVGVQLIGVMPKSGDVFAAACSGKKLSDSSVASNVMRAVAARLCGTQVPLVFH